MMTKDKNAWYDKLLNIPKPVIYIIMFFVVALPVLFKMQVSTYVTDEVQRIYDHMEQLYQYNQENPENKKAIFIAFDYDPATMAELDPMAFATLRHAFLRGIPVIAWSGLPTGVDLGEQDMHLIAKDYGAVYGQDYVFLGYGYPFVQAIIALATDVKTFFASDKAGNDTRDLPLLKNIYNFNRIGLVFSMSGTSYPESWVTYANGLYGKMVVTGSTAVSAAKYYPFLQTNQMIGLMGGLKGAAEYEQLVERLEKELNGKDTRAYMETLYDGKDLSQYNTAYYTPEFTSEEIQLSLARRNTARQGMAPQATAHFYVIILIIIGNIAYFARMRNNKR